MTVIIATRDMITIVIMTNIVPLLFYSNRRNFRQTGLDNLLIFAINLLIRDEGT